MAPYEVLAVRCGSRVTSREEFYLRFQTYGEPDAPLPMDYFFWALRGTNETILVDTGWAPAAAQRRGRTLLLDPAHAMAELGCGPGAVSRVVLTHLHWDHAGNVRLFPEATFVVQRRELDFWTGPFGRRLHFAAHAEPADVEAVAGAGREGRLALLDGDAELAPGVQAVLVGGHTPGLMILLVETEGGTVVLASDATHYYEELERDRPGSLVADVVETYAGFDLLRELAAREGTTLVPGHDPLVLERFPALAGPLGEHVARVG